MSNDNFDLEKEFQDTPKKKSYADLDLGLDFDLSFLDDIDESVLEEEVPKEKSPKKEVPEKKTSVSKEAPAKKEAAVKKESAPKKESAAKKGAPAKKAAPAKKPAATETAADAPVKKAPAKKAAPKAAEGEAAAAPAKKAASKKPAAPQEEPVNSKKKKKKGPRLGGVIFYTLYFLFILIFFIATYIGLQWLQGWLADFEAAQPTVKAEQVFQEVFTDPDWGALYDASGAQDSAYEGKEAYVNYMEAKVGDSTLTYEETSAGLSKDMKYVVRLGSEKIATFTLVDKNQTGDVSLENLENITDIPDWQLGAVEVFFERENTYYIVKMDGSTAYVNGVALGDDATIQIATTKAVDYLPEGTTGASLYTQQVTGLMEMPTITITDKDDNDAQVTYDETTRTFTERTESNTITEEQKELAINAAKTNCLWMIEEVTDRGTVAKYFDPSYKPYTDIVQTRELWMQNHGGYEFVDMQVTDFAMYNDDIFSVRVSTILRVARTDGSTRDYDYARSLFFHKTDAGKWLCFEATNVDVSEPVGKVRLTFMDGNTELYTDFYATDASEIVTPNIAIAQGQVFTGWVTIYENDEGATVYNLEFQPDETGIVSIPDGTTLKPMTLYAFVQDASEVQEVTELPTEAVQETVAETTSAETVPAETT